MNADFTALQIDLLVDPFHDADLQVNHAVLAERADRRAILRIESYQSIARRDVQHALITSSIGPVRHPAPRQLPRSDGCTLAFAQAVRPDLLARFRVQRHD